MRDLANLNLEVGLGVLGNKIGCREASTATGSFREARKTVSEGQKIGYEKDVFDYTEEQLELDRKEEELLEELRKVREQRNG